MGRNRPSRISQVRLDTCSDRDLVRIALERESKAAITYEAFAEELAASSPDDASMFRSMANKKRQHRALLALLLKDGFGEKVPFLRGKRVKGLSHEDRWLRQPSRDAKSMRARADQIEFCVARFYHLAAKHLVSSAVKDVFAKLEVAEDVRAEAPLCPGLQR